MNIYQVLGFFFLLPVCMAVHHSSSLKDPAVCTAPRPASYCYGGAFEVFYFEPLSNSCLKELGCTLHGNNFESREECERLCLRGTTQPQPRPMALFYPWVWL
ncbi:kunitz-type serine protease inhibitor nigrescinin-2-like [Amblyomma americanum]